MGNSNIIIQEKVRVGDKRYLVSTVKLLPEIQLFDSLFSALGRLPEPNAYETMVFRLGRDGEVADWGELYCRRYATEGAARLGHEAIAQASALPGLIAEYAQEYEPTGSDDEDDIPAEDSLEEEEAAGDVGLGESGSAA